MACRPDIDEVVDASLGPGDLAIKPRAAECEGIWSIKLGPSPLHAMQEGFIGP